MKYRSTRGGAPLASAAEAIVRGIAPDGGLYVPCEVPQLCVQEVYGLSYAQAAAKVLGLFLQEYSPDFLLSAAQEVYGPGFCGKAGHVQKVEEGRYVLELWHGPTCAFKDYALQLMPRLLVEAKRMLGDTRTTEILVATSGDTGKAALAGFAGLPGIQIAVFYPSHGTSEIQRLQMATQEGENVAVYAIRGNFDDAQAGVKRAFASEELREWMAAHGRALSSANSINWGRLVPQIVYYFYSYAQLVQAGELRDGAEVDFCVPTGNFGDILAGWYAKQMGLPVGRLICASNQNDVLTQFLSTGVYDAKRPFYKTSSPSMDILVSSNLERLLYHVTQDAGQVAVWMQALAQAGRYEVPQAVLDFQSGAMLNQLKSQASMYGIDSATFLQAMGVASEEAFLEQYAEDIKSSATQLLIIQAIAEDAKLKADDAALAKYFSDNMGTEDYSTYEEHFGRPYVSMVVLSELANNYLMDNAVNA